MRVLVAEATSGSASRAHGGANAPARAAGGTGNGGAGSLPVVTVTDGSPVPLPAPHGTSDGLPSPLDQLADLIETAAARNGEAVLVVPDRSRLVVLASDGGAAVAASAQYAASCAKSLESGGSDGIPKAKGASATCAIPEDALVIGVSAPAGLSAAAVAFKQADQALSVARRRGTPLVEHEDVAAGSVLPLLADDAVRAFADGLLRSLRDHDANGRGDLVASLRAWLSRHGQWDAAAADLGVHRHTLRYRMRRVEEILGRSLDDPDVRMELWLALKATG
jgi:PucR family transcriptional regulator, purine catabolism regulatory protein